MLRRIIGGVVLALASVFAPGTCFAAHDPTNALAQSASPYLRLHARDPVHWREWSADLVAQAGADDRLIFVSVGYFACHWCHVMQRESFSEPGAAALLNAHFVSVKVDRELDPARDAQLVRFVQATLGHAGWPLNVVLTPDGLPLFGFTYLPVEDFTRLLEQIVIRWTADREPLSGAARTVSEMLEAAERTPPAPAMDPAGVRALADAFTQQASESADGLAGGFGQSQKFPSAPQLALLLDSQRREPVEALAEFLRLTFGAMASLGLRDQLGGGFFRYVTDPGWQVPHFEKMLYDNALLAELYFDAAEVLDEPAFERIGMDTVAFMVRELAAPDGGFFSSLSAVDAADVEGGFYLFDAEELERVLDAEERRVVAAAWGFEGAPRIEHGYLPVQAAESGAEVARAVGLSAEEVTARLVSARRKLLAVRTERELPRDEKRLAAWNGLALSALVRASGRPGGARFELQARAVARLLTEDLREGSMLVRARTERPSGNETERQMVAPATLQDYAYVARGVIAFARTFGGEQHWTIAREIVEGAWERFRQQDGWRLSDAPGLPYSGIESAIADGPMPSPSAVLLDATMEVADRFGDDALAARARTVLLADDAALRPNAFFHATRILALLRWLPDHGL
ncbi:MAG: DUF255 domain-containing protein [Thiotrichales bacterium]|nr:DUF255 domain-containing protein [Thiotrichales bacterium]